MNRKTSRKNRSPDLHGLPERDAILKYLTDSNRPRSLRRIAESLGVEESNARQALDRRLRAMQRDGQIIKNRRGGYGLVDKMDLLRGRIIAHPDGYGFLKVDTGGDDLFLSPREMRGLLHGDRILARVTGIDKRGRREGALVEVLERANQQIVGRYYKEGNIGFVVPDNKRLHQDVLIPPANEGKAKPGQYVVTNILHQPDKHTQPVGDIVEILGDHMAADLAVEIAVRTYDLPCEWQDGVIKETRQFTEEICESDKEGRSDLRNLPIVTIDGEDARDFDDAVYCERQGTGWRLLVAIADVSHYVKPGTALDEEAELRGNSVYFPRRVIPMLPEILSNGLCSLKPNVDRLCLVCELNINKQGKVKNYRFLEGVISSAARLTYTQVAAMLVDKDVSSRKHYKSLLPHLENLYHLYQLVHKHRRSNAVIDFESTETRFVFDVNGGVENIQSYERNDAHRLIEEFMLSANVAAAEFLIKHEMPVLFRIHEIPKEEKLKDLRAFLGELGLSLGGGEEPSAKDYANLLDHIKKRDDRHLIETVLLRSLPLAVYSADNVGHFGLAFPVYTHFTSPIRRYPDLLIHRAIRHLLHHKSHNRFEYQRDDMHQFGAHCSMTERRADEATRDIIRWHKCEFMQEKVGEIFNGTISGVTSFGLFVELDDIYVEGLVHVTALPIDYYHFDPIGHRLRGERSNRVYRLANKVRVMVTRVDLDDKKIDFELVEG
ncbi:MAG: ribonuclease R [Gammaproteobacteria bacterium]|nr:ribonuclease R [Gammaproteobacteria bacterium]